MQAVLPNCYHYTRSEPLNGEFKICRGCETELDLSLFHRCRQQKDGRMLVCKTCRSTKRGQGIKVPDRMVNGELFRVCRYCKTEHALSAYLKSPKGLNGRGRKCNKCLNAARNQRLAASAGARLRKKECGRRFYDKHGSVYFAKYHTAQQRKEKEALYPNRRTARLLRTRLSDALRAYKNGRPVKTAKTLELLGCSIEFFARHIERQFQPEMTWSNRGMWRKNGPRVWHIDHIKPCASFDLTDPAQQRTCFHWSNMQPLWGADNISKGAHIYAT